MVVRMYRWTSKKERKERKIILKKNLEIINQKKTELTKKNEWMSLRCVIGRTESRLEWAPLASQTRILQTSWGLEIGSAAAIAAAAAAVELLLSF